MSRSLVVTVAVGLLIVAGGCSGGGSSAGPAVDAAASSLTAVPATATADGASTVVLTAVARDARGGVLAGRTATFHASGAGNTLSTSTTLTGEDGAAAVTLTSTVAGAKDVRVVIDGTEVTARPTVTFVAGAPARVEFTTEPAGGAAPAALAPVVRVRDAHDNPVAGVAVDLALEGGAAGAGLAGTTTSTTGPAGEATFDGLSVSRAGVGYTLVATAGVARATSAAFDVAAGPPSTGAGGASTTTAPPGPLPAGGAGASITVTVLDAHGNPVPGVPVSFASTGGTLSASTATSGADGTATARLASTAAGTFTVTASAGGQPLGAPATISFTPGAAAALVLASQPTAGTAGAALAPLVVAARDAFGNATPLPGPVTVALGTHPAGALLSGTTSAAAAEQASFSDLSIQRAGPSTLVVTSGALQVESAPVVIAPAAAAAMVISGLPSAVTAGEGLSLTVTLRDAFGNLATPYRGTVRLSSDDAAAALPADHAFAAADQGAFTFTGLELRTAGGRSVIATDPAAPALTAAVALAVGPAAPDAAASDLAAAAADPLAGDTVAITATVRDVFGNPVPGATVVLDATGTGHTLTQPGPTDALGVATGSLLASAAGARTITGRVGTVAFSDAPVVTFRPGPPDLAASSFAVEPASAPVDVEPTLTASVRDAHGNPVPGVPVSFASTGGTLSASTATSGADGLASLRLASTATGTFTVTASAGGQPLGAPATITFTPGAAAALVVTSQPASGTAGAALAPLVVAARDAHGNATALPGPVAVALGTHPAGALLSGTTSVTSAEQASFSDLSIQRAGVSTLVFTSGALQVESGPVAIAPAAAAAIALSGLPSTVTAGEGLSLTVTLRDAFGNLATGHRGTVRLSSDDAAAVLPADHAFVAADQGAFTFTGLQLRTAGGRSVIAADLAAPALTGAAALTVSAAAPATLAFAVAPSQTEAGATLAPAVDVAVFDAYGNLVTNRATEVTLSLAGGPALHGTAATLAVGGHALFTDLSVRQAAVGLTLTASADGAASVTSAAFTVSAAGPDAIASDLVAAPTDPLAGDTVTLTTTIRDAFGNPVPGATVSLQATGTDHTVMQPAAPTDALGVATGALFSTRAGARTVAAATGGVTVADAPVVTFRAGPPDLAASSLGAEPASVPVGAPSTLTASLRDAHGNPVPGVAVSFAATGGTLSAATVTTGADGTAAALLGSTTSGAFTVTAAAAGAPLGAPVTVAFTPGAAAALVLSSQPGGGTAGAALGAFVISARDAFGNATNLPGPVTVALGTHPVDAVLSGTTSVTAAAEASFADLSVQRTGASTLVFTSGALQVESGPVAIDPAAASTIAISGLPSAITAGEHRSLTVTLRDAFGNLAAGYRGTVRISSDDTAADLPLDHAFVAADQGAFTFTGLRLRTAGARAVIATDAGDPALGAVAAVDVAAAAPATLAFAVAPSNAEAGATLAVDVAVFDAHGNLVTNGATEVSLSLAGGPALHGTAATLAVGGHALFTDLSVRQVASGLTLTASADGAASVTSNPFAISAAGPDGVASDLVAGPTDALAGDTVTLTATVRDAFGNPVPGAAVALAATGTDHTLAQPGAQTDALGVATGSLSSTRAGARTVTATVGALTLADAPVVTFRPGPPDAAGSSLVAAPATAPDDWTPVALTVTVGDRYGNPVPAQVVSVTASGDATVTQPALPTSALGTTAALVRALTPGAQTLSAFVGATRVAQAVVTFTPSPPDAALSTVAVTPASLEADGVSTATATVTVLDVLGRPVAGAPVTLAHAGGAIPAPAEATTSASGVATFTITSTVAGSGPLTATVNPGPAAVVIDQRPALELRTPLFAVGGAAFGLRGDGLVLASPGLPDLAVPAGATAFTFAVEVPALTAYDVTVKAQPGGQRCTVSNGAGSVPDADVTGLLVSCDLRWAQVDGGVGFAAGVTTDGKLYTWGDNTYGQLGSGTFEPSEEPVLVGTGFAAVAVGAGHVLALATDGALFAWGDNWYGQLGLGSVDEMRNTPGHVGDGYAAVSAGRNHTLALKVDGTLHAWGANAEGQLGLGTTTDVGAPALVGAGYTQVSAGDEHTLALTTGGTLRAWGANWSGQLGDGTTSGSAAPVDIGTGFVAISAGASNSAALQGDGALHTWGQTSTYATTPTLAGTGYAAVVAGTAMTLAFRTDGTLVAWGDNTHGQLGDGTTTARESPVELGTGFTSAATGDHFALALDADGALHGWGVNGGGQLGGTALRAAPVRIGAGFAAVSAGESHTLALTTDGRLYAWGLNQYGELGDGTTAARSAPVLVGSGFTAIAAGGHHALALKGDALYAWGSNGSGQLGDGSRTQRASPVSIGTGYAAIAAGGSHSVAVKTGGALVTWGANWEGQLGNGGTVDRTSPVQIGTGYTSVAAGASHSLGLKADGTLHAWGLNSAGQLGDGSTTRRLSPVSVGAGFTAVRAGGNHTLGLKSSGALYRWGYDGTGQRSSPTLAGSSYLTAAAGNGFTLGLRSDGRLVAWGWNDQGQLGDGTWVARSSAATVGAGFAAVAAGVDHGAAITTGGELFTWGRDADAQLGVGRQIVRATPGRVILPSPAVDAAAYSPSPLIATAGVAMTPVAPRHTGLATSFAVSPALPAGLSQDPRTGAVSGTPAGAPATTSHVVTVSGPHGGTTTLLTITVQ